MLRLATSGKGWADFGHPEFGDFKLVHTNPDFSTSGLSAVVAEYYAATGKKEGLTEKDIAGARRAQARARHRALDRPLRRHDAVHRRPDQEGGPGLRERGGDGGGHAARLQPHARRAATSSSRSIPRRARSTPTPRSSCSTRRGCRAAQAAGAKAFQEYLAKEITPEVAAKSGFRPADRETAPVAPITAANGADPAQPERVLGLPEPRVLAAIKKAWREDRKPANILLVLDTSGSMNDEHRLKRAKEGLEVFFRERRAAGLGRADDLLRRDPAADRAGAAQQEPRRAAATRAQPDRRRRHRVLRRDRRGVRRRAGAEGDGAASTRWCCSPTARTPTRSSRVDEVVEHLEGQGDSANHVRVFTIAYSSGADRRRASSSSEIAAASGGHDYEGKTENIESVYRQISSFF